MKNYEPRKTRKNTKEFLTAKTLRDLRGEKKLSVYSEYSVVNLSLYLCSHKIEEFRYG